MARAYYRGLIQDSTARFVAGSVEVREVGTTTKIGETIYAAGTGATTQTNALSANGTGEFEIWLESPKRVDLYVTGTGLTPETLTVDIGAIGEEAINVKSHGALGDGTTDDTTAIQAAIDALPTAGGTVFFPPGTYIISAALACTVANTSIVGAGGLASTIKLANSSDDNMLEFSAASPSVRDIGFDQNGTNQTGSNLHTIHFTAACHNSHVERVRISNLDGFGIFVFAGPTSRVDGLFWRDNYIECATGATNDVIVPICFGGVVSGNYLSVEAQVAINLYESDNIACSDNYVLVNTAGGTGIAVSSCQGASVAGNTIKVAATSSYAFWVLKETDNGGARASKWTTITGNTMFATTTGSTALRLQTCSDIIFSDNVCDNFFDIIRYDTTAVSNVTACGNRITTLGLQFETQNITPTAYRYHDNFGFNPQGIASITVGASPYTYTNNDGVSEAIYIFGGTVSQIAKDSVNLFTSTDRTVWLEPGEAVVVTYSSAPTMKKDRK